MCVLFQSSDPFLDAKALTARHDELIKGKSLFLNDNYSLCYFTRYQWVVLG